MSSVTLKAIFNGDIRRVTLASASFTTLRETVASLFPTAGTNAVLKYDDSEGELVTLTSQSEFEQAVKDSLAVKKTLRIVVSAAGSVPQAKPVPTSSDSGSGQSAPAPSAPTENKTQSQIQVSAETKKEAKAEDNGRPDCGELKRLALAFITDCQVLAAIPEALTTVIDALLEASKKEEFLTTRGVIAKLLTVNVIKTHPSVQRLLPFLPAELPCLDAKLHEIQIEFIPVFGPLIKWLISKLPCVIEALPRIIEGIKAIPLPILFMLARCVAKFVKCKFPCLFDKILACCPCLAFLMPCLFGENEQGCEQSESADCGFNFNFGNGSGADFLGLAPLLPLFAGLFSSSAGNQQGFPGFPGFMQGQGQGPFGMPFPGPFAAGFGGPRGPCPFPGFGFGRRGFGGGFPHHRGGPFARGFGGFPFADSNEEHDTTEQQQPQSQQQDGQPVVHEGIVCDGCQTTPIVGIRFKCTTCPDFDLCEQCEAKGAHRADHPLIKLKAPRRHGRRFHRGFGGCPRFNGMNSRCGPCPTQATAQSTATSSQGIQATQSTSAAATQCLPTETNSAQTQTPSAPSTESKQTQADSKAQTADKATDATTTAAAAVENKTESFKPASLPAVPKPGQDTTTAAATQQQGLSLGDKYSVQLGALEAMGFSNRDLNVYMLERFQGNVQMVANWLLEKLRQ